MNNKLIYIINRLKKANQKSYKVFKYLQSLETKNYDEKLQININRICDIDEILSQLIIMAHIDLDVEDKQYEQL